MPSIKPPSGTRDFLPTEVRRRQRVMNVIRETYERHGFEPLETPAFERIETLTGKYGDEGDQLLFRILKRGDKLAEALAYANADALVDFGLRYDLTVPLARVVAAHRGQLPTPWKRYQMQPVWRADRPQRGRFREFWQCDVDMIGSSSVLAEAEVIAAVTEALGALSMDSFTVRVNDRRVLAGLMESAGVAPDRETAVLTAIDKLDKIGASGVTAELAAGGLADEAIARLAEWVLAPPAEASHAPQATLALLTRIFEGRSARGGEGVERLRALLGVLDAAPVPGRLTVDPSLARGLSYYTGPIFEIAVDGLSGSMGGGGRYDGLVGMFSGREIPAVGFSLGFERLLVLLEDRGWFADDGGALDVLVGLLDEDAIGACVGLARELRRAGLRVDLSTEAVKLGKQFKSAEERGIPYVALLGSREVVSGTVGLKNLRTGEQVTVERSKVAATLHALRAAERTAAG